MLTFSVSSVKIHTLEVEKIVHKLWTSLRMQDHLNRRNSYALIVVIFQFKIAQNMEKISYNLSANIVVRQLNGFVGETPIFVSPAINVNVMEIT